MTTKAVFQLEPLTCPSCVKKIETALSKTSGVKEVNVLFNAGKVKVELDTNIVQVKELGGVLEKLGYPAKSKKVS